MLRGYRWDHQTRPTLKGDHERAFDPVESGRGCRRGPEGCGGFHKFIILNQLQLGGNQRLQRGRRDKQVQGRGFGADVEIEGADGRKAHPIERGDQGI